MSGATYGSPWIHRDLREEGESCSVHRAARIIRKNKLKAQMGCKCSYIKGGKPGQVAADRNFSPEAPNKVWVSDITYVRTYEGFRYEATVLELYLRRILGYVVAH